MKSAPHLPLALLCPTLPRLGEVHLQSERHVSQGRVRDGQQLSAFEELLHGPLQVAPQSRLQLDRKSVV